MRHQIQREGDYGPQLLSSEGGYWVLLREVEAGSWELVSHHWS